MRRHFVSSLLVTATLVLGGCVADDGPSIFIAGNLLPDDDCLIETGNTRLLRGVLNVQRRGAYSVHLVVASQLIDRASDSPLRADPNIVLITGGEIELRDAAGSTLPFPGLPNPFTIATSIVVPSTEDKSTPAEAVGDLQVIPPVYVQALAAQLGDDPAAVEVVVVSVKMFGETTGGVEVEADEWLWPVDICQGYCTYRCPDDPMDEGTPCCTEGQDCETTLPATEPVCAPAP
jgi:hypothetical protein